VTYYLLPYNPHNVVTNPEKVNTGWHHTKVKGKGIPSSSKLAIIGAYSAAIGREEEQVGGTRRFTVQHKLQPVSGWIGKGLDGDTFIRPFQHKDGAKPFTPIVIHTAKAVVGN
jgi:hypothetical protein